MEEQREAAGPKSATIPTTLGELQVGDRVPGWFALCEVTETRRFVDGRALIVFTGPGDAGSELGPADTPWMRTLRPGETVDA